MSDNVERVTVICPVQLAGNKCISLDDDHPGVTIAGLVIPDIARKIRREGCGECWCVLERQRRKNEGSTRVH